MKNLEVFRIIRGVPTFVGLIERPDDGPAAFTYGSSYLEGPSAMELSCSLPLRREPFPEVQFRPYFEGLLPEHQIREALAERLGVRIDDYLSMLALNGLDCIGDVAFCPSDRVTSDGEDPAAPPADYYAPRYEPISNEDLSKATNDLASLADTTTRSRLSLAGSQHKVGLAHRPDEPIGDDWLRPLGGAASTHVLKTSSNPRIGDFEIVCMGAAPACGIIAAPTHGIGMASTIVASERFDRDAFIDRETGGLTVWRLHQEDMAQALGVTSSDKYLELEGGTYRAIAQLLWNRSVRAGFDLEQLARTAVYNYLVGNCDNHLKNLSILHEAEMIALAPAYDIICTTFFEVAPGVPRYSREMGMRLGSATDIDAVLPEDFGLLADDLGIGRRLMARICHDIADVAIDALMSAAEDHCDEDPAAPYAAEDLCADMAPRLAIIDSVSMRS